VQIEEDLAVHEPPGTDDVRQVSEDTSLLSVQNSRVLKNTFHWFSRCEFVVDHMVWSRDASEANEGFHWWKYEDIYIFAVLYKLGVQKKVILHVIHTI